MLEVHAILQRQRCNENITKKTGTLSDAYCTNINAQVKKTVSKQQKAELLIERFMKENLNDFKSYEPIGYSKIDTLKSEFPCTELGIVTLSLANLALSYHEESSNEINFSSYSTQRERLIP